MSSQTYLTIESVVEFIHVMLFFGVAGYYPARLVPRIWNSRFMNRYRRVWQAFLVTLITSQILWMSCPVTVLQRSLDELATGTTDHYGTISIPAVLGFDDMTWWHSFSPGTLAALSSAYLIACLIGLIGFGVITHIRSRRPVLQVST